MDKRYKILKMLNNTKTHYKKPNTQIRIYPFSENKPLLKFKRLNYGNFSLWFMYNSKSRKLVQIRLYKRNNKLIAKMVFRQKLLLYAVEDNCLQQLNLQQFKAYLQYKLHKHKQLLNLILMFLPKQ